MTVNEKDWQRAKARMEAGAQTCVLCRAEKLYESTARGVRTLLDWLDSGDDLRGFAAADRVVGRGAAFLYVLLGVACVYTPVISTPALTVLRDAGIEVFYDCETAGIRNRAGDGFCPVETAVLREERPETALPLIRETLRLLSHRDGNAAATNR